MAKISKVFTKETVDHLTGEVKTEETIFIKHVDNKEQFIRTYIQDIGALAKCNKAEQSTLLCCLKFLEYNTNQFILTPSRRKDICECSGLKLNTVNTAISKLMEKNILISQESWTYLMNPKIFFFGTDFERGAVIKATMVYIIGK